MAISKTLLLSFIFSVTLVIVSDVSARQLATKPFSTQQTQSVKLNEDGNGEPVSYPAQPSPYNGVTYPPSPFGGATYPTSPIDGATYPAPAVPQPNRP